MSKSALQVTYGIVLAISLVFAFAQYSMAQEEAASTTEEIATTTVFETPAPLVEEEVATTTIEVPTASTTVPEIVEETVVETPGNTTVEETDNILKIEEIKGVDAIIQAVVDTEETYFKKNEKYLQILAGGLLPDYEDGVFSEKFGATVPEEITVNVYDAPEGKGFQVVYRSATIVKAVGFGPEAASLTYTVETPAIDAATATTTATSTEEIVIATSAEEVATSTTETETSTPTADTTETAPTDENTDIGTSAPEVATKPEDVAEVIPVAEPDDTAEGEPDVPETTQEAPTTTQ